jgi:hypothetical protein
VPRLRRVTCDDPGYTRRRAGRECKGTLVLNYGPEATEEDVEVLQRLEAVDKRTEDPP